MKADLAEIALSEESDWQRFEELADAIQRACGGTWTVRLDGPDQRYWDLAVGNALVTLHLEHSLGISLFAARDAPDREASVRLVGRIGSLLTGIPA